MIYVVIVSGILVIMLIFLMWLICYGEPDNKLVLFVGATFMLCLIVFCFALSEVISPQIKPMDVYQGKLLLNMK